MRRRNLAVFCATIAFAMASPTVIPTMGMVYEVSAATVKINNKTATIAVGKKKQLKMLGTTKKVTWTSNNKGVAIVSTSGLVTGKKKGTATITAQIGTKKYTCKVTVQKPVISRTSLSLYQGDVCVLKIDGTDQKITWKSSNTSIATVSAAGKVTTKGKGSCTISASVLGKTYSCKIAVAAKPKSQYEIGEVWTVPGQWRMKVTSVEETTYRAGTSILKPEAVYVVNYTYENLGYVDRWGDLTGLYLNLDDSVFDSYGEKGYAYPYRITHYPKETSVGSTCEAQVCVGVNHKGDLRLEAMQYDGNTIRRAATFHIVTTK